MLKVLTIYFTETQITYSIFAFITGMPPCSTWEKTARFDADASNSSKPDKDVQHFVTIGNV